MATIDDQIAQLEAQLNSGATAASIDGQSGSFDLAQARRRLRELREQKAASAGALPKRPAFTRILTAQ